MPLARPSSRENAFTLVEVLTALAVIAILVGLSVGMLRSSTQRSAVARARSELAALTQALEAYKQHYGDYPQTGNAAQAPFVVGARVTMAQAQAQLFNALTGVYGPTSFTTRINGPVFVELSKFRTEVDMEDPTMKTVVSVPKGTPPVKDPVANCFLDPWGNRYLYYYKPAPLPGQPPGSQWRLPGYLLYSAGPDGKVGSGTTGQGTADTGLNTATGLYTGTGQTTGFNADNIYATP